MRPQTGLGGETLPADVTMEWTVFRALHLGVVVAQVLLQIGQLDEGATALRQMALVGALAYCVGEGEKTDRSLVQLTHMCRLKNV